MIVIRGKDGEKMSYVRNGKMMWEIFLEKKLFRNMIFMLKKCVWNECRLEVWIHW